MTEEKHPQGTLTPLTSHHVSDEEVSHMLQSLNEEGCVWANEVQYLSKAWVRVIMSQPYKRRRDQRRPFDYSRNKLKDYLQWRIRCQITDKIAQSISTNDPKMSYYSTNSPGSLYWYGVDSGKRPILWYLANKTCFRSANVQKEVENGALVMQAALDAMPETMHSLNFVICFDEFHATQAMTKPNFAPAFIKTCMRICPDRLERAYFVTGAIGHMFHRVANTLAPKNIMDKVVAVRSREAAATLMVRDGVLKKSSVPTFMGGQHIHDEAITTNFKNMIETITKEMNQVQ